jgi:hypothetical protein
MSAPAPAQSPPRALVLDTHIALELCLFDDPRWFALRQDLMERRQRWWHTALMRVEFERVLTYPRVQRAVAKWHGAPAVPARCARALQQFEAWSLPFDGPLQAAPVRVRDPEDQMFVDLALALSAHLASRDAAVAQAWRRLQRMGYVNWGLLDAG